MAKTIREELYSKVYDWDNLLLAYHDSKLGKKIGMLLKYLMNIGKRI